MKKTVEFLLVTCIVVLTACSQSPENKKAKTWSEEEIQAETKRLDSFLDKVYDEALDRDPMRQTYLGIKKDYDKWTDISDEFAQKEMEIAKKELEEMRKNFNFDKLGSQAKISYQLFEIQATEKVDNFKWRFHNYPVNQMGGLQSELPAFMMNMHAVSDERDARSYISRLSKINTLFDQLIVNLKIREEKNIIPPKFVFPFVLSDCKNILKGKPFEEKAKNDCDLLSDFKTKVKALKLDSERENELIVQCSEALQSSVKPAYDKLVSYWIELEKKSTEDEGIWKVPGGDEYYNVALKTNTTTSLTADEIHEIGLREVARIHKEMREIMRKVNFKNDNLKDFFEFTRNDKQFYFSNDSVGKKEYKARATSIIDNMRAKLDALFVTKPKAGIIVKAVEAFREKSAGGAFYEQPSLDGSRPGTYYINLYAMADQPIYQMEALAYHEGIPGHHMQISIAQELKGIPKFRTQGGNTAYVEGWALYSEQVPKEIGFYQDPYSDFGRLSMELFRAARLVVDTGIHRKKWSRKKALDYFNENISNPEGDNRKEIDRYVVWPGQATGYMIGKLKILELREKAKQKLGSKFDIREFHDVILTSGPLPLNLLEELVDEWITGKK